MPSVEEAAQGPNTNLAADLQQGVETISLNQTITFEPYVRLILPLDGYVFWVKKSSMGDSAMLNMMGFNSAEPNSSSLTTSPSAFQAKGSLHYTTDGGQSEEANSSRNRVVFTAEEPIQDLNAIDSQILYIGTWEGVRFAFSNRNSYYQQAGLWHYTGSALYSTMDPQIVEDPNTLLNKGLIVSNSLPSWLSLNNYNPPWPVPVPMPNIRFYPSFLTPDNIDPPFISVHIEPRSGGSWQALPHLDALTNQSQLGWDRVTLTLFGCNNRMAEDIYYAIMQYSYDEEAFGILNMPDISDEKEPQVEFHTLAQKKKIVFDVSYTKGTMRDIARQLITSCIPTVDTWDQPSS